MSSSKRGKNISEIEVLGITKHGFWLSITGKEYLVSFRKYPWFKTATVAQIMDAKLYHGHHLHWPDLDVDLELSCLEDDSRYPMVFHP